MLYPVELGVREFIIMPEKGSAGKGEAYVVYCEIECGAALLAWDRSVVIELSAGVMGFVVLRCLFGVAVSWPTLLNGEIRAPIMIAGGSGGLLCYNPGHGETIEF
jgi:hypothetical protein